MSAATPSNAYTQALNAFNQASTEVKELKAKDVVLRNKVTQISNQTLQAAFSSEPTITGYTNPLKQVESELEENSRALVEAEKNFQVAQAKLQSLQPNNALTQAQAAVKQASLKVEDLERKKQDLTRFLNQFENDLSIPNLQSSHNTRQFEEVNAQLEENEKALKAAKEALKLAENKLQALQPKTQTASNKQQAIEDAIAEAEKEVKSLESKLNTNETSVVLSQQSSALRQKRNELLIQNELNDNDIEAEYDDLTESINETERELNKVIALENKLFSAQVTLESMKSFLEDADVEATLKSLENPMQETDEFDLTKLDKIDIKIQVYTNMIQRFGIPTKHSHNPLAEDENEVNKAQLIVNNLEAQKTKREEELKFLRADSNTADIPIVETELNNLNAELDEAINDLNAAKLILATKREFLEDKEPEKTLIHFKNMVSKTRYTFVSKNEPLADEEREKINFKISIYKIMLEDKRKRKKELETKTQ